MIKLAIEAGDIQTLKEVCMFILSQHHIPMDMEVGGTNMVTGVKWNIEMQDNIISREGFDA